MDTPALTWEELRTTLRVCRMNEASGHLECGTVTEGEFDITVLWDSHPTPESYRRFYFNDNKAPLYREGCPALALAMEWGRQVLMVKALNYRPDLLLNKPEILPILQQIRALVGDDEVNDLIKRYQSMSALPKGQRLLDLCIKHLPEEN